MTLPINVDIHRDGGRGATASSPGCTSRCASRVDGMRSDDRRLTTAFRAVAVRDWQWWINGEPIFVMGANHGPTRMALGRGHRRGARARRRARGSGEPRPAPHPRTRHPARALRRGRRRRAPALAGLPAAVGIRPRRPQAGRTPGARDGRPARPPPERRHLVRAQRAARGRRSSPASRMRPRQAARVGAQHVPAVVEQGRARPLGQPRDPQGRPDALRRRALGDLAGRRQRRHRHPLLLRVVPRPDGRARARAAPMPRLARFVSEFGAQAVPGPRRSWSPSAGPTSTGTGSS